MGSMTFTLSHITAEVSASVSLVHSNPPFHLSSVVDYVEACSSFETEQFSARRDSDIVLSDGVGTC